MTGPAVFLDCHPNASPRRTVHHFGAETIGPLDIISVTV